MLRYRVDTKFGWSEHYGMTPRTRRWLEVYDRRFGLIAVLSLVVGSVGFFIIAAPFMAAGASSFKELSVFQILILAGPIEGSVIACAMLYARRRIEKILDSSVPVPCLIQRAQLGPLRIAKYSAALQAAFLGLALDSPGSRRAWMNASDSPDALFLTIYDRYEAAMNSGDLEVAHAELAKIFNPKSMAAACYIVYQLYSEHLKDRLLKTFFKSVFRRWAATDKLECAIAEFMLKDYKESVNFFYSLVADRVSSPPEKGACLRIANLIISAAATDDPRWQRLHVEIFGDLVAIHPRITAFNSLPSG
jgi:hypothetical protein